MNSFEIILLSTLIRGALIVLLLLLAGRLLSLRHMRRLWLFGCLLILVPQTSFSFLPFRVDLSGLRQEKGQPLRVLLKEAARLNTRSRSLRDPVLAQAGIPFPDRRILELLLIPLLPAGALLLLGRRYRRCRKLMRNLPPVTDVRTLESWKEIIRKHGALKHPPVLLDSREVTAAPALFGCFHPKLMLPGDRLAALTTEELELLLEHEYRHLAGGDQFRNLISLLCWSLSWYNPFAWIARRELRNVIEQECDRQLLEEHCGRMETYGKLLLRFSSVRTTLTLALAESPRELKARIRLLTAPGNRSRSRIILLVLALLLASPLCLVAVKLHPEQKKSAAVAALDMTPGDLPDQ